MLLQDKTLDRNKPWMHKVLVYLISDQFWSAKGDAIKMGKQNNLYVQFPDPLLALCATVVHIFSIFYLTGPLIRLLVSRFSAP